MEELYLGEFEEIVLLAICGVEAGEAYAVPIQQHIEERAERLTSIGSVYRTLNRLEKKGFVRSWMGEVTRERGGKRKRFYQVSSLGRDRLLDARRTRNALWKDVKLAPSLSLRSMP